MKTIEQRIIAKQDEYIKIADKILGEWECSGCALTEFRREIYALKAQLKEQDEEMKRRVKEELVEAQYFLALHPDQNDYMIANVKNYINSQGDADDNSCELWDEWQRYYDIVQKAKSHQP